MILNMPVNNGAITSNTSSSQSEFSNFLKRKYSENDESHVPSTSKATNYETPSRNHNSNWKKRHLENTEGEQNYGLQQTSCNPNSEQYNHRESVQNSDTGTETYNIIASSTFINDLFAYDANLIVPVSSEGALTTDQSMFSTPSTVCATSNKRLYEDDDQNSDNWQASDLLELDHRYNSSLQTEITHLNPTVSLKPGDESSSLSSEFILPDKPVLDTNTSPTISKRLSSTSSTSISSSSASNSFTQEHLEQDCDFEDKNLSWLLNFKFDEFPHLNPDVTGATASASSTSKNQNNGGYSITNNTTTSTTTPSNSSSSAYGKSTVSPSLPSNSHNGLVVNERSKSPKNSNKTVKKFEELVMEVTSEMDGSEMIVAENVIIEESSHRAPKKPPFTYTELIEYALEDKGELTVSGIYQWISDRFPYYKSNDDRWKNSVRHNLSINPHFRKGHKAPQGAGHLWTISSGDSAENVLAWEHKKQRLDLFFKMESVNRERLQQHQQQLQQQQLQQQHASGQHKHIGCQPDQCLYDEAAVAAAAIQQEMLQQSQNNNDATHQNQNSMLHSQRHQHNTNSMDSTSHVLHELPYNDLLTDEELRKTAGQILNGIHREVEVQSVNHHHQIIGTYQDVLLDNDYLNPIHKDVVVNESGLRHTSSSSAVSSHCHSSHSSTGPYYVTEIDPLELGIQMSTNHNHHHHHHHHGHDHSSNVNEESDVVLFNDEFNLNYFTYNPSSDIVA